MYDIATAKVNTLVRPDGLKKAYVRLNPDYDALDVANKIGEPPNPHTLHTARLCRGQDYVSMWSGSFVKNKPSTYKRSVCI